ncbi:MAG: DUF3644 domain-containing protein [Candidatus Methanofastidiosa archaeon]|nr:DUF3644 domain-containing protein [Candidatus Methanofastidiosa archaeon]
MDVIVRGKVKNLLDKAKESCILTIDVYNKPKTTFRSGAYIILMSIAWTSLFHAIFQRTRINYFYKIKNTRFYEKIDGEPKAWELEKCVKEYFKTKTDKKYEAIKQNIKFFIPLRNRIEHRFMPELDEDIFSECQSLLHNFEEILTEEFGNKHAINESLTFSLQFAKLNPNNRKTKTSNDFLIIKKQIMDFRNKLPDEIYSDQRYSFKAYLLPKLSNNQNRADCAIEWVPYDPSNPEEMAKYTHLVGFIKERITPVFNLDLLRAKEVSENVRKELTKIFGVKIKFSANHHYICCMEYNVRPPNSGKNRKKTRKEFCVYDQIHDDYLYTQKWIDFLIKKLKAEKEFLRIFPKQRSIIEGLLTSSRVIKEVKKQVNANYGIDVKFSSHDHLACCQHYKIRPLKGQEPKDRTKREYCVYEGNNNYLYTAAWVEYLVDKLSDGAEFSKVLPNKSGLIGNWEIH